MRHCRFHFALIDAAYYATIFSCFADIILLLRRHYAIITPLMPAR